VLALLPKPQLFTAVVTKKKLLFLLQNGLFVVQLLLWLAVLALSPSCATLTTVASSG